MDERMMLVLIAMCAIVAVSSVDSVKIDLELVENFGKLNEFLEKNVNTDDLEANVNAAYGELKSIVSPMLDDSLKEALETFVQLPLATANNKDCKYSFYMLEHFDARLYDEAHNTTKNYPVNRVERIMAIVAYKNYRMCRLGTELSAPFMKFSFKQSAYDQINDDLVDKELSHDPEANMKAAEEILSSLDNKDGSYGRALEQFLSLRTILTQESCNEQGMEILMKNLLGNRKRLHRITTVAKYYTTKHAEVCHPIYLERVLPHANELDLQTYKKVLAFLGGHWFRGDLDPFLAEVESKDHVGLNFTTSLFETKDRSVKISSSEFLGGRELLNYMKAVTKQEPEKYKYLGWVIDERAGKRVRGDDKVAKLYDEYIIEPCEEFIGKFEADMRVFNYNFELFSGTVRYNMPAPLNFRLLTSAYNICVPHINRRSSNISKMMHYIEDGQAKF